MLGAVAGDMIGSRFEHEPHKAKDFRLFSLESRFTDDTVLTFATAWSILNGTEYARNYRFFYRKYPFAGYGGMFTRWALSEEQIPYNSFGNGAAMRVSPVGWLFDDLESVMEQAEKSAAVTHNHPEGIKGAQAVAGAIYLARTGSDKGHIRELVGSRFGYDLSRSLDQIRPGYGFDVTCQGSVPESILCFLEAESFEESVRNGVSLGGDADTMACIAGSIAEGYFGQVPEPIIQEVRTRLDPFLQEILDRFEGEVAARRGG